MLEQQLLHYKILARLGEGGMGVVYKALDTHLGRLVALKVLPADKTADPDRKRRFVQEARAASALNHPNIVTIHDIATDGGIDFIVMEHVAGKGLDQLILAGIPPGHVLKYAVQISSAIAKAHSAGIIHRDLKPANIMVGPDDDVKVLDFGLAKLSEGTSSPNDATLPPTQTEVGMVVGTASYMSPEQAEGKPVDGRSDIFSFGLVLYEMLTGRRAFEHPTAASTTAAVLRDEPKPISSIAPSTPRELERVVGRCLRKNPDRRYQTMTDLRIALEDLKQESDSGRLPASALASAIGVKQSRRGLAFAGVAVLVAATALGTVWMLKKKDTVRTPPTVQRLTFDSGLALHPAVSPDGKYVAFASDRSGERNLDIWVQALPGGEPVRLTKNTADEDFPSFSPDGTKIAFQSEHDGRAIYSIPILGGEPRLLAQKASQPRYSPDGQWLSFTIPDVAYGQTSLAAAVFLMPAEGGERTRFQTGFLSSSNPIWSPDSSRLLYAGSDVHYASEALRFGLRGGGAAWYVTPVLGGQPVRIENSVEFAPFLAAFPLPLAWLKENRILFSYASGDAVNLWIATLSKDNRRIVGAPEQLTFGTGRITDASVAASGTVAFATTVTRPRLWNISLDKKQAPDNNDPIPVVTKRDFTYWPSLSHTGKLAYLAQTSGKWNLWLRDLPSGKETLLASVFGNMNLISAYINHTGTRLGYTSVQNSKEVIYTVGTEGGTPERICEDCGQLRAWVPDGGAMLSQERVFEGSKWVSVRINRIDLASGRKTVLLDKHTFLFAPDVSPDGRWVAFQARASVADRKEQLFLTSMGDSAPVDPERWIAITELKHFDAGPTFSRDGRTLYFTSDRDGFTCVWAVHLNPATGKPLAAPVPVKHFHGNPRHYSWYPTFGVAPDRVVISMEQIQTDLWMTKLPE